MKPGSLLWYNSPAKAWTQSLPIGNGTLGGMIYGSTFKELISLNHDQLWTGKPKNTIKDGAPEAFAKARALALEGKLHEAQEEIEYSNGIEEVFGNEKNKETIKDLIKKKKTTDGFDKSDVVKSS